ncbi:MAG: prepilin peptidase [Clostridiales Family XIII bacterium]|jgi:leader peptidase (prepilin peptidase)/N-methyltransferase|nr:prepilin peptidase [Clostridiales Family XIII bacterium]
MLYVAYACLCLFVFAVGAVIGSFLNVVVYRLPRKINVAKGFSFCPACEHRLYPKDLIPLFSYLFLGGKCRYCKAKISPRYFLVETLAGAALLLFCIGFGLPAAILYFAVFSCLLCITLIDADTQEIPDSLNLAILICGVAAIWVQADVSLLSRFIGLFVISLPLFLISLIISGAFGMGDVKLMFAAGFLLGWQHALVAFFIALLLGGVYGVIVLATRKKGRKDHFAFGPCLAAGICVALLCGEEILRIYLATM